MYAPSPEKIKVIKELARPEIVFASARKPGTGRIFFGGSDFKVYDVDLDKDKPEPKELGGHESYVTGLALAGTSLVSGGYDGRLIWWDIGVAARRSARSTRIASGSAASRPRPTARSWPAWPTTWSAGSGTPPSGRLIHELRGHEEKTPHHFPSMLYACAISSGRPHCWRPATRSATSSSGRSNPAAGSPSWRRRASTPGTRSSGGTRSAASARWPSRPTARGSPSAASARSATSTTSTASPGSRCSTGGRASGLGEFSGRRPAAWSSGWSSTPTATGCSPPAATPTASSSSATRRQESPRADQGPDVRPRLRPQRGRRPALRRRPSEDRTPAAREVSAAGGRSRLRSDRPGRR